MVVARVLPHPNADSLRIYEMNAPSVEGLVVVGNLETDYAVGDVVAVARVGALLPDGTEIRKTRLRGVDSFGLTLGRSDAAPGTDLNAELGGTAAAADPEHAGVALAKWASIELLQHVRADIAASGVEPPSPTYRAKIKLDGTNAALHSRPDGFVAQSRTRLLTSDDDNYGFAAWALRERAWADGLHARVGPAVVYGEWCGQGIQKRTAISKVPRNVFAVFAIQLGDPGRDSARLVIEPDRIAAMLPEHADVFVLPWYGEPVRLDFGDETQLQAGVERLNAMVEVVERCDPWVADVFGIEGLGEGLVLYPVQGVGFDEGGAADRDQLASLMFKAKGDKHRVARQKKAVVIDPEVAKSIDDFVSMMVTPARLEQGLEAIGGIADMRKLGDFLRWVGQDVRKESVRELEAAGLEWKQVARRVSEVAKAWFSSRTQ